MLARWRAQRDPALADAIDLLCAVEHVEPFAGSVDQRLAAWHEAVEAGQLARALASFPIGAIAEGTAQLERLAAIDDPRVCTRLLGLLDDPPYRSPASLGFWRRALAIVEGLRDPRALAWVQHHAKRIQAECAPPMGRLLERELEASAKRMMKLASVEPAAEHAELLAALRRRHQGDKQADELLAAIYENPEDDAARLVYADRLGSAGDPRGEFIILQVAHERGQATRESKKRERELAKQYAAIWLGELGPVINKTGLKYRRGFPDTVVFAANNEAQVEKLVGHPAWATVRSLEMDSHWQFQATVDRMILDPGFRSLRELHGYTSPELLDALATSKTPRPITALTFNQLSMQPSIGWSIDHGYTRMPAEGPRVPAAQRKILTEARGLPKLRDLTLHWLFRVDAKYMRWLFSGALGMQLERFATRVGAEFLPTYMRELEDHPLAVFETLGEESRATYTLTRGESGRLDQLRVVFRSTNRERWDATPKPGPFENFLAMLDGLGDDELARLALEWPNKKAPTVAQRSRLDTIVGARSSLELTCPDA